MFALMGIGDWWLGKSGGARETAIDVIDCEL